MHSQNHPIQILPSDQLCFMVSLNIIIIHWFRLSDATDQPHVFLSRIPRRVLALVIVPALTINLASHSKLIALDLAIFLIHLYLATAINHLCNVF